MITSQRPFLQDRKIFACSFVGFIAVALRSGVGVSSSNLRLLLAATPTAIFPPAQARAIVSAIVLFVFSKSDPRNRCLFVSPSVLILSRVATEADCAARINSDRSCLLNPSVNVSLASVWSRYSSVVPSARNAPMSLALGSYASVMSANTASWP